MPLRKRKRAFEPDKSGAFRVNLDADMRNFLTNLSTDISAIVALDLPVTRRLFPTDYPRDSAKDAGHQNFGRVQLIAHRQSAADTLRATADNERLTAEELSQWMSVVNDARLVLGTRLDVSEDDELDLEDPNIELRLVYEQLGYLVDQMVKALATGLPEPSGDAG